jgi:GNAT superfamily N-acetyltransferase
VQQMEYAIRMPQEQDGPELARLRWDFRSESGDEEPAVAEHEFAAAYEAFFRGGLLDQSRGHWIAEQGGRIVAHVVVQKVDMVPRPCKLNDQWGYVTDNYTRPEYRNRGIGRVLLDRAIAWSREADLELLIAWPSARAIGHYRRAGFTGDTDVVELRLRGYYDPSWAAPAR